jgi:dTDP-4-amino-4,6-dideoxygalactose transaminase
MTTVNTDIAVPYLDLRRQHELAATPITEAVLRVTRSGWYVLGPEVEAFEAEFAAWCGVPHCVGVGNGLDALTLVLRAWGIGAGDEVIVPSNTYIATWLAVTAVGARPVPVEPDVATGLLDPTRVAAALSDRTRAILPVHLYGRCADMSALRALATSHGIPLLADAAQAHGAIQNGGRVGALADAEAFSFYPTKNLGALGDGGCVTTADAELADRLRVLRNYGSRRKYDNEILGVNSRLDEMQAAVLRAQLPLVDGWNARRREIAGRYTEGLSDLSDLVPPQVPADLGEHVWHVYNISYPRRDQLQTALRALGVGTQIFYPTPPHLSEAYAALELPASVGTIAAELASTSLALPIAPYLRDEEVDWVISAVRRCLGRVPAQPVTASGNPHDPVSVPSPHDSPAPTAVR